MANYFEQSIAEVERELKTGPHGLSAAEASTRQRKYGANTLPKKKKDGIVKIFLSEFMDPIVLLLLVAIVVSFFVGEIVDAVAIIFIVLVDAIIGTYQENKANNTADALSKLVKDEVHVIRDGKDVSIGVEKLTIGDLVLLESGDKIGADMRVIEAHNFTVDESILTGESVQVAKTNEALNGKKLSISDRENMVFSGTTVVTGRAKAYVTEIGLDTELGKIADSLATTEDEKSPLTIRVEKFSKQISVMVVAVAIVIAILLIAKHTPGHEILLTVIAFAVSAMPEGLPLALTMALTIAANKMSKKNVIVRKLNAAESLGSCTVIASDKTGTLTVNQQTAKRIVLPNGEEYQITGTGYETKGRVIGNVPKYAEEIGLYGALNNEADISGKTPIGDSIDIAFLVLAAKLGVKTKGIKILERIPYESENKYSAVFYEKDGKTFCTVKGSLEVVKDFCDKVNFASSKNTTKLKQQNENLAKDGFRVIAVANGEIRKSNNYDANNIKNLTFMGMVGFIDPIRKEAVVSIRECHEAGIKVLMITGDHPLTALSIAKDLKLAETEAQVATGDEVAEAARGSKHSFDDFIAGKTVFARVAPLQKLKIVESLKRQGEFVAVTGDGVNDAPALKVANIGIAMGSGTDIARETADMIIIDDNFKSIVAGVQEGRVAFANIRKIIYFLISCGLAEAAFFCLAIACDMPMPLVAVQLLWLNVVTDGIQDLALSFETAEPSILKEKPRDPKQSIFDKRLIREIAISGAIITGVVFAFYWYLIHGLQMEITTARGYIMCLMVFIQNIHVFNCRSESRSAFSVPLKNNWFIAIGIICTILLQIVVMKVPIFSKFLQTVSIPFWAIIWLFIVASSILILMELYKNIASRFRKD
ncbi:HAD-IC family P-type ATPase [Candidatus Saccharibacteria bacterium]|nr:HAD-IC family P-type ATPase [Candidatus Saccharibacteria bacterium]